MMKKVLATVMSLAFLVSFYPAVSTADTAVCPEVEAAKTMLKQQASMSGDVKAPRSLAGARSQDIQAPRSQDVQAPRSQDVQAPRSQDVQAPRSQMTAARSAEMKKATTLVQEAEAACKAGKKDMAAEKAKAAMEMLKK